jgi:two-component system, chemotaxis family, protein-glutamate methylesterase/glutaminase
MIKKINVLIVEDQSIVRKIFKNFLKEIPEIDQIYEAADAYEARDILEQYNPDIMTLDMELPKLHGLEFLKKLIPQYPIPVIVVSTFSKKGCELTIEALEAGALDFITKPDGTTTSILQCKTEYIQKILQYAHVDLKKQFNSPSILPPSSSNTPTSKKIKLITIGASTGGTNAIRYVLSNLPKNYPPILVVQHMPIGFTKMFADRMRNDNKINIFEVNQEEKIQENTIYLAPGDKHIFLQGSNNLTVALSQNDKLNGHRPSVDFCFNSISKLNIAKETLAIILTGMGADGAKGIKELKEKGAYTIGQDQQSSVVYGMPKVAYEIGGITEQLPLNSIPNRVKTLLEKK